MNFLLPGESHSRPVDRKEDKGLRAVQERSSTASGTRFVTEAIVN